MRCAVASRRSTKRKAWAGCKITWTTASRRCWASRGCWTWTSTVKTLYGHQEGAELGYNPDKPGRPSHAYHTYMLSSLRLVLRVDVLPGDRYNVAHATDGLWTLLDHLGASRRPALLRGDKSWGIEPVMARAERE